MKKYRPLIQMVQQFFAQLDILKKMTFSFFLLIIIPSFLLSFYIFNQIDRFLKEMLIKNGQSYLERVASDVENKTEIIENLALNITNNPRFQLFMCEDFKMSPATLIEYRDFISPLVDYAHLFYMNDSYQIRVYINNPTIPEAFGRFFSTERIKDDEWYTRAMDSSDQITWIGLPRNSIKLIEIERDSNPNEVFKLIVKIPATLESKIRNPGIIVVDVLSRSLFSPLENGISDEFDTLHNSEVEELAIDLKDGKGYLMVDNELSIFQKIETLDRFILLKQTFPGIKGFKKSIYLIPLILVVSTLVLLSLFLVLIRSLVKKVGQNLQLMQQSIEKGFTLRIPVPKDDEFGQIASHFNKAIDEIQLLLEEIVKRETAKKDAQLRSLQFQINPHFIYNTLEVFRMRAEIARLYEVSDGIADFGSILRYNLDSHLLFTTIKDEIKNLQHYFRIEKLKYGENISLTVTIDPGIENFKMIKFLLQPIVENSLIHGIERKKQHLQVDLDIHFIEGKKHLEIVVRDDGIGISEEKLQKMNRFFTDEKQMDRFSGNQSIGLSNINERIRLFYGQKYHLDIRSEKKCFTEVRMKLPVIEEMAE